MFLASFFIKRNLNIQENFTKFTPNVFLLKFKKELSHSDPTRLSHLNYVKPIPKFNKYKFSISCSGLFVWNNCLSTTNKQITDFVQFKALTKYNLLSLENKVSFF